MAYTTIKKPSDYFNTKLYSGNGSTQSITGVGFQPDLLWQKSRSNAYGNMWFDAVRGASQRLMSNTTGGESGTSPDSITSFDSDGFSLGADIAVNGNGTTNVAWNWKANGAGVANTDGSISSTVSANTTSGFSIVSYSGGGSFGDTVGHGLNSVPAMIIVKCTSASSDWYIWQKNMGANDNQFMAFNTSALQTSGATIFDVSAMSNTTFTLGTNIDVNGSGRTFVAYCFAEKKGFSKFGSYIGNGSTDGTFVYTGFKPAFVLTKASSDTKDWVMLDNKRDSFNLMNKKLFSNNTDVEYSGQNACDFLSNGFKLRDNATNAFAINDSGRTQIYMAFAEEPLVGDNPATAR